MVECKRVHSSEKTLIHRKLANFLYFAWLICANFPGAPGGAAPGPLLQICRNLPGQISTSARPQQICSAKQPCELFPATLPRLNFLFGPSIFLFEPSNFFVWTIKFFVWTIKFFVWTIKFFVCTIKFFVCTIKFSSFVKKSLQKRHLWSKMWQSRSIYLMGQCNGRS